MRKRFSVTFFHIILLVLVAGGLGYVFGTHNISASWKGFTPIVAVENKSAPNSQNLDMQLFYEVLTTVNAEYFDKSKIDSKKVLYGAISGMLASLDDPFTSFFPPKENEAFKTQLAGEFSGIGAELGLTGEKRVSIISPLDNSPAQKAGIKAGDLILKVNDEDTAGWTLAQAVEKIRGPRGSTVKLSILHTDSEKPLDLTVTRDTIVLHSVTNWIKDFTCTADSCKEQPAGSGNTVAYIRLSQFGDKTNDEWVKAVNELYPQILAKKNFQGLVLDLRNNPGGYLQDAVFIGSEFVKSGTIVSQVDGKGNKEDMNVTRTGVLTEIPVIVLINKGSASASEIVAGALRDHNRAKLLGETSFGKGTIQQAIDLENGTSSVHVSIAKWITPKGTWVDKKGLEPDIKVVFDEKKTVNGIDNQLQAAVRELLK